MSVRQRHVNDLDVPVAGCLRGLLLLRHNVSRRRFVLIGAEALGAA